MSTTTCDTRPPPVRNESLPENQGNPVLAGIDVTRMSGIGDAAASALLLMAVLAGTIGLKTAIFLSRLHY